MINNSLFFKEKANFWLDNNSLFQQDTTFRPTAKDTVEAQAYGVDPIFIMNERRTKEIEEFKIKQKQIAAWRAKQYLKPKTDTTCYICPKGEKAELYQIVQSPIETTNGFSLTQNILFDKSSFRTTNHFSKGTVFIEEVTQSKEIYLNQEVSRPEQSKHQSNWFFFPLFALILILAILKVFYSRFINYLLKSSVYLVVASKMHRENSLLGQRIVIILDIIYFLSTSIFIVFAADYFQFLPIWERGTLSLAFVTIITLLIFRILRYLTIFLSGNLSQTQHELQELYFHQLIYTRIFGLFLVPLLLIFAYSKGVFAPVSMYLIFATLVMLLIMRGIRSLKVFINKGFSIFYFLLYLCALEIAPVLVFLKEIFWE